MSLAASMLSYWDGDSWENVIQTNTTTSAIHSLSIIDEISTPKAAIIQILNTSPNIFSGSGANSKGPYTGVFTNFMPVRIIDDESKDIIFTGLFME